MRDSYSFTGADFVLRVFWADDIRNERISKGWIADVSADNQSIVGITTDPTTAKELAILVAKHLFRRADKDVPEALENPQWTSALEI